MTRRMITRLVMAAGSLVALAVIGLVATIVATSRPVVMPPPLPTATALPFATPNDQVQAQVAAGHGQAALWVDLAYRDVARPTDTNPPCDSRGQWSLEVNPNAAIGRPFTSMPNGSSWARAASAISLAGAICLRPVRLSWIGHDKTHPSSDSWQALLPANLIPRVDGSQLRLFALRHARQV